MQNFGKRLKTYREKKRLSIKDIAEAVTVSTSTYREWENGRSIIGEPYMALAEILSISLTELLTGEKPKIEDDLQAIEDHVKNIRKFL